MSNPSSAVALYNAWRVAKTPSRPLDSLTNDNWFHISHAVVAPLMCIISASLIASSIWVHAFVSPFSVLLFQQLSVLICWLVLLILHQLQYIFPVQGLVVPQAFITSTASNSRLSAFPFGNFQMYVLLTFLIKI